MGKTLIVSVGGSLPPVICSINYHQPENIIFFASVETQFQIPEIIRQINLKKYRHAEIITESAENLNLCLRALLSKLHDILSSWKTSFNEVIVDYTGGTKSMSSALVMATVDYTKCFSYVGAKNDNSRTEGGIGVVIDGQEKVIILGNPWDELAIGNKKKICILFNSGRYLLAKEVSQEAANKVSEREKNIFEILADISEAYHKWDSFDYDGAFHFLNKAISGLSFYCSPLSNHHSLVSFLKQANENLKFLNLIRYGTEDMKKAKGRNKTDEEKRAEELKKQEFRLIDLIANARRRANVENRYDDALVRLYRAIEKRAQIELTKYNIDASNVNLDLVPKKIREEIKAKYYNEKKGKIEVSLYAAYYLLKASEEEKAQPGFGHKFFESYDILLASIINLRNSSIIVHGNIPSDENKFNNAWQACLRFLEIDEQRLPQFPQLNF